MNETAELAFRSFVALGPDAPLSDIGLAGIMRHTFVAGWDAADVAYRQTRIEHGKHVPRSWYCPECGATCYVYGDDGQWQRTCPEHGPVWADVSYERPVPRE